MSHSQEAISFPDAIAKTQDLMQQISDRQLSEADISREIASLVSTQAGARGFFVGYLTGELSLADTPSQGVVTGLESAPNVVSDLLVKNVAMSTAMRLTHERNDDSIAAAGSAKVTSRSIKLIELLQTSELKQRLQDLTSSIEQSKGKYEQFLIRWGYDQEQKRVIAQTIAQIAI